MSRQGDFFEDFKIKPVHPAPYKRRSAPPPTDESLPHIPGSATSRAAAENARHNAPTQRERVRMFIEQRGREGATLDEIELGLAIAHQSVSPRMRELLEARQVIRLEETRRTRRGCYAAVLVTPEHIDARPIVPFMKYELVLVSRDAFAAAFPELDAAALDTRWKVMHQASKRLRASKKGQ